MTRTGPGARKGAALVALPDSQEIGVRLDAKGQPRMHLPNGLLPPRATLDWLEPLVWSAWAPRPPGLPAPPRPDWAVNLVADPEGAAAGLIAHDDWLGTAVPVFNHPRAVAQTRPDLAARRLAGVPGLAVPACVRFIGDSAGAFARAFAAQGFRFPVLVRPAGSADGALRVEGPDGWAEAAASRWVGTPHVMTEARGSPDPLPWTRVLVVGGQVPVGAAAEGPLDPGVTAACAEVARRLGLDVCAIDLGLDPAGQHPVLIACSPAVEVFDEGQAAALDALLADRSRWVAGKGGLDGLPRVREALADAPLRLV